jgi:hypothetical protein
MKHGGGTKGLDDKSSGMEILMVETFAKIKPTDPLILAGHAERRKRTLRDIFATPFFFLFLRLASLCLTGIASWNEFD